MKSCGRCLVLLRAVIGVCPLWTGSDGEAGQSSVWRRLREPQESLPQAAAVPGDGETHPLASLCLFRCSWMLLIIQLLQISPVVSLQLEIDPLDMLVSL